MDNKRTAVYSTHCQIRYDKYSKQSSAKVERSLALKQRVQTFHRWNGMALV
jgi:hypothetical protein